MLLLVSCSVACGVYPYLLVCVQVLKSRGYDHRCDIWSLGVVLYIGEYYLLCTSLNVKA